MATQSKILVADIGGTNARIGVVSNGILEHERVFLCAEFENIDALLADYLSEIDQTIKDAVIAVACAVNSDDIVFTNMNWRFNVSKLAQRFRFDRLKVLNDFSALAMAIPYLTKDQCRRIENRQAEHVHAKEDSAIGLIGAGTGLGVSGLLPGANGWLPIEGEGGHVRYGPANSFENELFHVIAPDGAYISAEYLLSGAGLLRLYKGISQVNGVGINCNTPGEVVSSGNNNSDAICRQTLDLYCGIFGDVAGDLALILNAGGGIYIGGGVVNHMADFFCESKDFRTRFEKKGLKAETLQAIPTFLISDTNAALIGASFAHQQAFEKVGCTYLKAS